MHDMRGARGSLSNSSRLHQPRLAAAIRALLMQWWWPCWLCWVGRLHPSLRPGWKSPTAGQPPLDGSVQPITVQRLPSACTAVGPCKPWTCSFHSVEQARANSLAPFLTSQPLRKSANTRQREGSGGGTLMCKCCLICMPPASQPRTQHQNPHPLPTLGLVCPALAALPMLALRNL